MKIPRTARYAYATKKAYKFLEENGVTSLPLDPFKIAELMDIPVTPYSEISLHDGYSLEELNRIFSSEDGVTLYQDGYYYILYNDAPESIGRIRFTILHELGHIYLDHFTDFEQTALTRSQLTSREYQVLENEVNCFARNALSPLPVVMSLPQKTYLVLKKIFNISEKAAQTRLSFLKSDLYNMSNQLFSRMEARFSQHIFNMNNSHFCERCGTTQIYITPQFCLVCGQSDLIKKDNYTGVVDEMIYPGVSTNEQGKAHTCPRCQNEQTNIFGEYCIQCGAYLYNFCSITDFDYNNEEFRPCPSTLPGNARHCPSCGAETTFLGQALLEKWDKVKGKASENPFLAENNPWVRQ